MIGNIVVFLVGMLAVSVADELPFLDFGGFSWAENLAFDGIGGLFVSEAIRGEIWKIELCNNGTAYCGSVYITDGLKQAGGMSFTKDGATLYAGATMDDDSKAVIVHQTAAGAGSYEVLLGGLKHQPNGMAFDEANGVLYVTDEGKGSDEGGTLLAINVATREQTLIKDHIPGADGCWFDPSTGLLFVGELLSMRVMTFKVDDATGLAVFVGEYEGLNSSGKLHMLDDLTVARRGAAGGDGSDTLLFGCDWTGKELKMFRVDGTEISTVSTPGIDMYQPTSVRWGAGPGFDPNSVYVTEGGGVTKHQNKRRVFQVKIDA
jgi:sugar lactone lactonase YvrE